MFVEKGKEVNTNAKSIVTKRQVPSIFVFSAAIQISSSELGPDRIGNSFEEIIN